MSQGRVINIMIIGVLFQFLQLTVLQFLKRKTALMLLTCPVTSAPKRVAFCTYLRVNGYAPELVNGCHRGRSLTS